MGLGERLRAQTNRTGLARCAIHFHEMGVYSANHDARARVTKFSLVQDRFDFRVRKRKALL